MNISAYLLYLVFVISNLITTEMIYTHALWFNNQTDQSIHIAHLYWDCTDPRPYREAHNITPQKKDYKFLLTQDFKFNTFGEQPRFEIFSPGKIKITRIDGNTYYQRKEMEK